MTLPTTTEPGYGERQLAPEDIVKQARLGGGDPEALIVWFYSLEDEKENRNLESGIFADEPTALLLRKFKRVKIDIESVSDPKLRREYGTTPCFVSVDPEGAAIGKVAGKDSLSRSRFKGFVNDAWTTLYTMRDKDYLGQMKKILDRLDKVSGKMTVLNAKKTRLAKRPNPSKMRALAREEAELKEEEAKIQQDEEEIKKACTFRDKYLPQAEGSE